ncbi:MAG: amino acid adenylation domain-containing protein, partial [Pseudohongiellaceae bacterium]
MTDDPGSPESLSPARRELLRRRLAQQQEKQRPPSGPVRGEAGSGPQPLSFAQERFWFLEQLEPGSPDYTITVPGIICGLLQVDLLRLALNDMVQRHPALRMCFPARDGVPSQQLAEAGKVELPLIVREDLGAESLRSQRDLATADYAQEQHKRGFDLGTGPLFRATVVRFSDAAHAFIVSLHHIIADGWSLSVMMTDLTAFYNGRRRGVAALLPEPAVSYADWAHWQRKRLSGEPLAQLLGHWRGVLDGAPMHLELPHDLARPPTPGHTGATQHYPLPAELITQLRARAAELNTTPFVTLLAAFKAYCLRITGETDLVLGTSIANRDHVHLSQVVGPCLNTLALRTVASNEQTFAEFVTAVRSTVHGALSRPELPFEKLVDALQPVRDPSRSPIFNVFFDMVVPLPEPHWDGLDSYSIDFERGTALFDLSLSVEDRGHSMLCALQFNTELFLPQTAERLWHHFTVLLGSALKDPQQTLGELELLDGGDKEQLQQWAEASQLDHDRSAWVHRQIAAQAQTTPDAAALIEDGRVTTYGELDRAANAFAWRLTGMGAGPDVLIAVCLPRSSCVLQTLLGIWKAGAAYLPLSPDDPHERLAVIVDDTQPAVIVTLSTLAERFAGLSCQLLFVDQPGDECTSTTENAQRAAPPSPETSADDLAYVIFTSGSTGEPKGVMISHAALTNHIAWVRDAFDISASDRFVLRTPFTFDASIWEIVHPLVSGASLIIAAPGLQRDPAGLLKLVATEQVTVMQTVPSMLRSWLDEPRFSEVTSLRHLICAGEALLPDLVARFDERCLAAGLPTQLHNLYGPSEATIDSTMHSCQRGTGEIAQGREAVPIGRPISNTVVHVLDASRQLLPVGVVGELVIAGEGLAKGYLHRPDLTRERFVDNPLGKGKVYLSGDLGRRLPDGSLEYVGRIDSQVKVNGHRIELGEVEAVLCEHPDVGEAAVIADGQSGEQRRLLAYYVPRQSCSPTTTDLRKFVETRLPRYMIPAAFLSLPTLPRTSSEKLDRRALPRPEALRPDLAEQFAAPVTATEQTITQIMVELLELDRVGLHDDFFALGGHSLLATKLSSRIRQNLGVEMPLMDFFECPTVAALATVVDGSQSHDDRQIQSAPDQPDHPVSFGQQRLWFLSQLEPEATHYHMTGAMGLAGPLNVDALQAALDALVARHDALHTALRWRSGELRQVVLAPAPVALLLVDQSHHASTAEQDAAVHTELDALGQEAFDLSTAPLLRGRLITLGQDNHVLALCQHHIVSDGRSLQLLLSELGQLYRAACSGEAHQLPPLAIGTVDHAHWQRSR